MSTFQFNGRLPTVENLIMKSTSESSKPSRQPSDANSSVVPGCSETTAASWSSSSSLAQRDATGLPSPSEWVRARVVENPSPPDRMPSARSWHISSISSWVASRSTAAEPITRRRSAQCPTRNPALMPSRPSSRSRYSGKEVQSQSMPFSSAASGMPSTLAIIRLV